MHAIALAQWAHDIRNTLGTVALYLETLERSSEPDTVATVARTNALLAKAAGMCADAVREASRNGVEVRRCSFDVMKTIGQVFDLVAPLVPAATVLRVEGRGPVMVMADPQDVFRILFNLVHNAVGVARRSDTVRRIELFVEPMGAAVRIQIVDDGLGLPDGIRSNLFRRGHSTTGSSGYGLSIARELAERNGGMLDLLPGGSGTAFLLELQRVQSQTQRTPPAHDIWAMQPSFA
jgi:signal transduction histidine kinase